MHRLEFIFFGHKLPLLQEYVSYSCDLIVMPKIFQEYFPHVTDSHQTNNQINQIKQILFTRNIKNEVL